MKILLIAASCLLSFSEVFGGDPSQSDAITTDLIIAKISEASKIGDSEAFENVFRSIMAYTSPDKEVRRRHLLSLCARLRTSVKDSLGVYNDRKLRPITRENMTPADKYPSGISPDAIAEPDIRKKYETALAENHTRSELNIKLARLDRMIVSIDRYAASLISVAYANTPEDRAAMAADLAGFDNANEIIKSSESL